MNELDGLTDEQIAKLLSIRRRVIDSIGKNMDLYGITLSVGHLYGHMFFNQHPVTLDEMGSVMGMSKTSMSTGMRTLYDRKFINKVWAKGSRKDLYQVEQDWYQNFTDFFSIEWRQALEQNRSAINRTLKEMSSLRQEYDEDSHFLAVLDHDESKLMESLKYYRWLERLIESFDSGDIYSFIPKEE